MELKTETILDQTLKNFTTIMLHHLITILKINLGEMTHSQKKICKNFEHDSKQ